MEAPDQVSFSTRPPVSLMFRLRPKHTPEGFWLLDVFVGPKGARQLSGTIWLLDGDEYLMLLPALKAAGEVEAP